MVVVIALALVMGRVPEVRNGGGNGEEGDGLCWFEPVSMMEGRYKHSFITSVFIRDNL